MKLYRITWKSATAISAAAVILSLSPAAQASDILDRTPADAYQSPSTYTPSSDAWTGIYMSVFGGYGLADWDGPFSYDDAGVGDTFDRRSKNISDQNWFAGLGIGGDQQFGQVVIGGVIDVAYGEFGGTENFVPYPGGDYTWETDTSIEYFGTARARAGYLLKPNFLVYATGGLAWAMVDSDITVHDGDPSTTASGTSENNHIGWTAGAGIEWKLTDTISFGAEYLYVDLGEVDYRFAGSKSNGNGIYATDNFHPDLELQVIKAQLNYRF